MTLKNLILCSVSALFFALTACGVTPETTDDGSLLQEPAANFSESEGDALTSVQIANFRKAIEGNYQLKSKATGVFIDSIQFGADGKVSATQACLTCFAAPGDLSGTYDISYTTLKLKVVNSFTKQSAVRKFTYLVFKNANGSKTLYLKEVGDVTRRYVSAAAPVCQPLLTCKLNCGSAGYKKDANGCDTCACAPVVCKPSCVMQCGPGERRKKDADGCVLCECEPNVCPTPAVQTCPAGQTMKKDVNGCLTGICEPVTCQPVLCEIFCSNGFKKDANGCDVCVCAPSTNACRRDGCSNQLCVDASSPPVASTCEWREEYACYNAARCEVQANGKCGHTPSATLTKCIADANKP